MTSIERGAFSDCTSLTSIKVESGNTKYDSRENCNAIIETESNKLIAGCKNSFIPNSVTSIGESAFSGCSGLTSITIPNNVTSIGLGAFYECSSLAEITIGNSVTSIGEWAFSGCIGLYSIKIPNSVTSIENGAFSQCSGLSEVIIGNGVTNIGMNAFSECSSLNDVYCFAENVPNTDAYAFSNYWINQKTTLHVPATSLNDYSNAEPWKYFKAIVAMTNQEMSVDGIKNGDVSEVARYSIGGQRASQHTNGLNIIRMSDGTVRKIFEK